MNFKTLIGRFYRCFCIWWFLRDRGVTQCGGLRIIGWPIIQVSLGAKIMIGQNVTLNSRNFGYHANMHSPVKLMSDQKDAVIKIGDDTRINGACLHARKRIEIGKNCLIAANVQIFDSNGHPSMFDQPNRRKDLYDVGQDILIGDNVWIGLNSIILPGVTIGDGSIIAANTVVSRNVPPLTLFAGNPGRVVKNFNG